MELTEQLKTYSPCNEQERADRATMLALLGTGADLFTRGNTVCHFTASAWTVDPERALVLMAYHNLYDSWAWLGGHADGERDLLSVALREVAEESGLSRVRPVTDGIFSLETLVVDGHEKRGAYVPSHLHLNVTYLVAADSSLPVHCKPDENSGVRWFSPRDAVAASKEPWFRERIYKKLNAKIPKYLSGFDAAI